MVLNKFGLFGPKIIIFTGESKHFGTHVTEKPPTHLVRIVFWSGMGPNLGFGLNTEISGPNFGPFVALGESVHFPRWERFFDFSFPSYGRFRKKKSLPPPH